MQKTKQEQPLPPGMKVLDLSEYRDSAEVERIRQQMAAKLPPMPSYHDKHGLARALDTICYTAVIFVCGVLVGMVLMTIH